MSTGFSFGTVTPQQQQQQQQPQQQQGGQPVTQFGAPLAQSTPSFAAVTGNQGVGVASLFGTNPAAPTAAVAGTGFSFSSPATNQPPAQTGFSLGLGGTAPTATAPAQAGTGFSFSTPATSQPPAQTGFSLGLGGTTVTSVAPAPGTVGTGFSFGPTNVAAPTATSTASAPITTGATASFGGLGGIPNNAGPRMSTLALGGDPGTGWSTRNDNRNVQELPVPPEIITVVEELKNQMKNHKAMMMEVSRAFDTEIDSVAEQIEEVRLSVTTLSNLMHRQELQSAALIKDMQDMGKDMDLLSQARDVPTFGYGGTSSLLYNFLFELMDKYAVRMAKYKLEIERAEFSLQTIVGAYQINAKDLWASLTAIKDTVILLAAQIQQLHEDLRKELTVHKNITQVLFATSPKPWLSSAISGNLETDQSAPPLERVLNTPSKAVNAANSLENMYQRTYSMFNRVPSSLNDPRGPGATQASDPLRTPAQTSNLGGQAYSPSFHPSIMGSYLGPSSPATGASLKRSKK